MSNENESQNSAEVACPRCDGCGQLANSDEREPWSVWMALPVGSALAVTMGLVKPEPCDECGGTGKATQPAGEHHTGTLNLTGEGNAPGSPISGDLVKTAAEHMHGVEQTYFGPSSYAPHIAQMLARAALEAAYPAIRQQVAEEIAVALESEARSDYDAADDLRWAATKAREIGGAE